MVPKCVKVSILSNCREIKIILCIYVLFYTEKKFISKGYFWYHVNSKWLNIHLCVPHNLSTQILLLLRISFVVLIFSPYIPSQHQLIQTSVCHPGVFSFSQEFCPLKISIKPLWQINFQEYNWIHTVCVDHRITSWNVEISH